MSKWNLKKKKCLPIVKKISPQLLLLHSRLKKKIKKIIEINNKTKKSMIKTTKKISLHMEITICLLLLNKTP
jgi:hypothetical protein